MTAGAGGPITGKCADLLIVNDPVKNDKESRSATPGSGSGNGGSRWLPHVCDLVDWLSLFRRAGIEMT